MATINRENIGLLNDRITVTVKEDDYNPGFQKMLKQYSKDANIPGFRKGMVPTGLIKKMYGKSLFPQEVLKAVEDGLNDYMKEEKLDLFGNPMLQDTSAPQVDMNKPETYSFDFEIGLKPELDVETLKKKLQFSRYKILPDEKEIDEQVKQLQQRAGTLEEIEETADEDNVVSFSIQLTDKDGNVPEEEENHDDRYRLGYFAPEFRKTLTGKKKEDKFTVQLKDAFEGKELDWLIEDWKVDKEKAPENYYTFTINKIEKLNIKELNEAFFQEVYPDSEIKTEEDFRKKVAEDSQKQWEQQANHLLEHEMFEKLVNEISIELPEPFLKKQLKVENGKAKTDEEVEAEYPEFEKQTKWGVISSRIINEEKMDASPDEVRDYIRQQVMGYFQMPVVTEESEGMINELTNRLMQEEKRIDEAYRTILTNKLFDWLIEKSDIEDKEISKEDFIKLQEEHNHQHHEHG